MMPTIHVSRSCLIDAPKEQIRKVLMNFQESTNWSPWLVIDPDAKVAFSAHQGQVGSGFSWDGELVGSGQMKLIDADERDIEMKVHFIKPFKSTAKSIFTLEEHEGQTEVMWHMHSTLPWYMFFMTKKMHHFIGMDYERGLGMLKAYIETGTVASSIMIEGVVQMQGEKYVGIPNSCAIQEVGEVMKEDYTRLFDFIADNAITLEKMPFSIYNSFDIPNNQTAFISCIPYDGDAPLPEGFIAGELATQNAIKTIHTGAYKHLGNAWTAAMTYARVKKLKTTKALMGIEFYPNDPDNTPEEELTTEIYLPVR